VGLEVHDCSTLQRGLTLKKGNCVTIEPGVYVPNSEKWPKSFRGIGVRIEDDVVVGDKKGTQIVLSAVKEIVDIEALRD
jgi:intermediate cleaving peptidase 55